MYPKVFRQYICIAFYNIISKFQDRVVINNVLPQTSLFQIYICV